MRILVNDFSGYAFPVDLSRWLAAHGHEVQHTYGKDNAHAPQGDLAQRDASRPQPAIVGLGRGKPFPRYNLVKRFLGEYGYAGIVARSVREFRPDVVISADTPPIIQTALLNTTHDCGGMFVYWVQDIFSVIFERIIPKKVPLFGHFLARRFREREFGLMRNSEAVVVISEDFVPVCISEGVPAEKIATIRNWAPLDEIAPAPRDNSWAREHGLAGKFVFLFSGTLGLKHNPRLISQLALSLKDRPDAVVVVVSQGLGRQWLEEEAKAKAIANLRLFDYQPFTEISNVLGSADVLVAILEPFAGEFSVPSKILSYLCTARPLLAALPEKNLASRIVLGAGAGDVVSPLDENGFLQAAHALMNDPARRERCAAAGRAYAEETFNIDRIGRRFLEVFENARKAR